jgi:hypothetical protein
LGTTPIVWFACALVDVADRARARESIDSFNAPQSGAYWLSSMMDAEARWRYSRWSAGEHVVLLDGGAVKAPKMLVADMDAHIKRMASLLGEAVPPLRTRWVRGPLLGQEAKAIIDWAVTGPNEDFAALTPLDRHEVAHALIFQLCGFEDNPPALLSEGWAEFQSQNADEQLRELALLRQRGEADSLNELVDPRMYHRHWRPAYSHGGPFVRYLVERFGGPKFLELYRNVHAADTFEVDLVETLGVPWPRLQADFWQWVDDEAARLPPAKETEKARTKLAAWEEVELAPGVDPRLWRTIVDGFYQSSKPMAPVPRDVAVAFHVQTGHVNDPRANRRSGEFRAAFRGKSIWCYGRATDGVVDYLMITAERSAELLGLRGKSKTITELPAYQNPEAAADLWRSHVPPTNPEFWLPLGRTVIYPGFQIESIEQPAAGETRWIVVATRPQPGGVQRTTVELESKYDWHVSRWLRESPSGNGSTAVAELGRVGGCVVALKTEATYGDGSTGHQTMRMMTPDEEAALRAQVEQALQPASTLRTVTTRPITYAVAWPSLAIALLGAHVLNRRRVATARLRSSGRNCIDL